MKQFRFVDTVGHNLCPDNEVCSVVGEQEWLLIDANVVLCCKCAELFCIDTHTRCPKCGARAGRHGWYAKHNPSCKMVTESESGNRICLESYTVAPSVTGVIKNGKGVLTDCLMTITVSSEEQAVFQAGAGLVKKDDCNYPFLDKVIGRLCPGIDAPQNKGLLTALLNMLEDKSCKQYPQTTVMDVEASLRAMYGDCIVDLLKTMPEACVLSYRENFLRVYSQMPEEVRDAAWYLLTHGVIDVSDFINIQDDKAYSTPLEYAQFLYRYAIVYGSQSAAVFNTRVKNQDFAAYICHTGDRHYSMRKKAVGVQLDKIANEGISFDTLRALADCAPKQKKE